MKTILIYIGQEEFVGKTAVEVARHYGVDNAFQNIQICGDRGSSLGYDVGRQYVVRIGDAAILFENK